MRFQLDCPLDSERPIITITRHPADVGLLCVKVEGRPLRPEERDGIAGCLRLMPNGMEVNDAARMLQTMLDTLSAGHRYVVKGHDAPQNP